MLAEHSTHRTASNPSKILLFQLTTNYIAQVTHYIHITQRLCLRTCQTSVVNLTQQKECTSIKELDWLMVLSMGHFLGY